MGLFSGIGKVFKAAGRVINNTGEKEAVTEQRELLAKERSQRDIELAQAKIEFDKIVNGVIHGFKVLIDGIDYKEKQIFEPTNPDNYRKYLG